MLQLANDSTYQKVHVHCLYNVHKKLPAILEDEPRHIDPKKLTSFKIIAPYARASILEYVGALRYVKQGEEEDLGIEDHSVRMESQSRVSTSIELEGK